MSRAEMRRLQREQKKSETVTYNLTKAQLDAMVNEKFRDELRKVKKEATEDAVRTAMTLPLEVLIDHYWQKSCSDRIPKFTAHVIDYYKKWESGELDMDKLQADLWERGRVKIVEE